MCSLCHSLLTTMGLSAPYSRRTVESWLPREVGGGQVWFVRELLVLQGVDHICGVKA